MDTLLYKYFSGTISNDEKAELFNKIETDAQLKKEYASLQNTMALSLMQKKEGDDEWATAKLSELKRSYSHRVIKRAAYKCLKYAAMVAVVCLVGWLTYVDGQKKAKSEFAQDVVIEVPPSSTTKISLPDGTVAWLNAGSVIKYSQNYGITNRAITLEGEGYFKVKKDANLPFSVQTANLHINDIGTSFNVSDYATDEEASIALIEGVVDFHIVGKDGKVYRLKPNQRAAYNKHSGEVAILEAQTMAQQSRQWINGNIDFNGMPLQGIVKVLERNYSVSIKVVNPNLYKYRFQGNFRRQEQSLEEILSYLSATGKIHYRMKGRNVEIY